MAWEIIEEDIPARKIQCVATTPILQFQDDVVIQVRKEESDSVVEMRSKSRVGRSDFGVNAERIRKLFQDLWKKKWGVQNSPKLILDEKYKK